MSIRTIIEPFRIKSAETIRRATRKERQKLIAAAGYNLVLINSEEILGSPSFVRFRDSVQAIFRFRHVIPATRAVPRNAPFLMSLARKATSRQNPWLRARSLGAVSAPFHRPSQARGRLAPSGLGPNGARPCLPRRRELPRDRGLGPRRDECAQTAFHSVILISHGNRHH
jgi:hypothetical protein